MVYNCTCSLTRWYNSCSIFFEAERGRAARGLASDTETCWRFSRMGRAQRNALQPDLSELWGTTLVAVSNSSANDSVVPWVSQSRRKGMLPLYTDILDRKAVHLCESYESRGIKAPLTCLWDPITTCEPSGQPCELLSRLRKIDGTSADAAGFRLADERVLRALPPQQIPRVVVQTGPTFVRSMAKYARHMQSWWRLNPEYVYIYFNDSQSSRYVVAHATASERRAWRALVIKASRADLFRLLYLKYHGGVYADLDAELGRPLRELVRHNSSAVTGKMWPFECMIFAPHHPIIVAAVKNAVANVLEQIELHRNQSGLRCHRPVDCVIHVTGPAPYEQAIFEVATANGCDRKNRKILPRACRGARGIMQSVQHCDWQRPLHWGPQWGSDLNGVPMWECNAFRHWDCRWTRAYDACHPMDKHSLHWTLRSGRSGVWFQTNESEPVASVNES